LSKTLTVRKCSLVRNHESIPHFNSNSFLPSPPTTRRQSSRNTLGVPPTTRHQSSRNTLRVPPTSPPPIEEERKGFRETTLWRRGKPLKKKQFPGQGKVDDRKHHPESKVDDRKHPPGGGGGGGDRGVGGVGGGDDERDKKSIS